MFSILFFIFTLLIIAPSPWEKNKLWIARDISLKNNDKEFLGYISNSLTEIFSIPLLFNKYDIYFINTSPKDCDQDIRITIKKDADFFPVANKYFKNGIDGGSFISYKINEDEQIIIKAYPIDKKINYTTIVLSGLDTYELVINKEGKIFPNPNCPNYDIKEMMNVYSILNFYAKPNLFNWIASAFAIFFASIVFFSSLRGVMEKK